MESKAHYALIGTFVLLSLIAALVFVAWLSNSQFDRQYDDYEVVFNGPVRGLSQGSEVRFNGLNVGDVTNLRLDSQDSNSVIVDVQVNRGTPVDSKSYARLEPLGLTGLNYIQIFSGGENYPLLKDLPGKGPYRIRGEMSQLDSFLDEGGTVIEQASSALGRINAAFNEEAIADLQGILSNLNAFTAKLRDAEISEDALSDVLKAFERAANRVAETAITIDVAAQDFDALVKDDVGPLMAQAEVTLRNVDAALAEYQELANDGSDLAVDARDAINRLSNSGVADLEETTDQLRRLIVTLNRVADGLERNPGQFLAGEERQSMELPQ